jgi:hypothetical protein
LHADVEMAASLRDADDIRRGADEYAVGVLVGLEGDVVKTLQSIKNGISMLDERRATIDTNGATGNDGVVDERWEDEAGEPADAPR